MQISGLLVHGREQLCVKTCRSGFVICTRRYTLRVGKYNMGSVVHNTAAILSKRPFFITADRKPFPMTLMKVSTIWDLPSVATLRFQNTCTQVPSSTWNN